MGDNGGWPTNIDNSISSYSFVNKKKIQHHIDASMFSTNDEKLESFIPVHKNSKLITKQKPHKIRIIHIIPPQIIQTDKANFRYLVQSLTGCQSSSAANSTIRKTKRLQPPHMSSYQNRSYLLGFIGSANIRPNPNKNILDDTNHEVAAKWPMMRDEMETWIWQ